MVSWNEGAARHGVEGAPGCLDAAVLIVASVQAVDVPVLARAVGPVGLDVPSYQPSDPAHPASKKKEALPVHRDLLGRCVVVRRGKRSTRTPVLRSGQPGMVCGEGSGECTLDRWDRGAPKRIEVYMLYNCIHGVYIWGVAGQISLFSTNGLDAQEYP